jgi:hypothetical protein
MVGWANGAISLFCSATAAVSLREKNGPLRGQRLRAVTANCAESGPGAVQFKRLNSAIEIPVAKLVAIPVDFRPMFVDAME